ncbi:hypothetical protein A2U01_0017472 [Trifolium medium]|uniref:Uncharacterized protein n=1 Tax=Trifolium medium TaxID=97028 RepID=A0A392N9I4_9FABA|nr:hypothetical protein [Trifolium medium]
MVGDQKKNGGGDGQVGDLVVVRMTWLAVVVKAA